MSAEQVTVKIVTDQITTPVLLEVRIYITSALDCSLLIESGNMNGLIDSEVEVQLQHYSPLRVTTYLGNLQRMAIRVKVPVPGTGLFDVVRFTAVDHASRLIQNPPRAWSGRMFDVSIQRAKVHRDYPGKKRSRFLV